LFTSRRKALLNGAPLLSLVAGGSVAAAVGLPLPSRAEGERVEVAPGEWEGEAAAAAAAAAAAQGTTESSSPPKSKFAFEVEEVRKGDGSAPPAKGDLVGLLYKLNAVDP
jgi:hypothetical protein